MRDIRSDLRERLSAIDERMSELVREYNRAKEEIDKSFAERERLLGQERAAAAAMLLVEGRRYGDEDPASNPMQLADFLIAQVEGRAGVSKEDLRKAAVDNGYFADGEASGRSVHFTLLNLVRAKRLVAVGDNHYRVPVSQPAEGNLTLLGQGAFQ